MEYREMRRDLTVDIGRSNITICIALLVYVWNTPAWSDLLDEGRTNFRRRLANLLAFCVLMVYGGNALTHLASWAIVEAILPLNGCIQLRLQQ